MGKAIKIIFCAILVLNLTILFGQTVYAININYKEFTKISKTSDFDLDYFLEHSALNLLLSESTIKEIEEKEVVKEFKNLCQLDTYKYITIYNNADYNYINSSSRGYRFNGYVFLLHNEKIYTTSDTYQGQTRNYLVSSGEIKRLTISEQGNGAYTTIQANKATQIYNDYITSCKLYNGYTALNRSGYFTFSTSGIYKANLEDYAYLWGSNSQANFTCQKNKLIYTDFPILIDYNPYLYFEYNQDLIETTGFIKGFEQTIGTINLINSNSLSQITKIGTVQAGAKVEPTNLYTVYLNEYAPSGGTYKYVKGYQLYQESTSITNPYEYVDPIISGDKIIYWNVYIPKNYLHEASIYQIQINTKFGINENGYDNWDVTDRSRYFMIKYTNNGIGGTISGDIIIETPSRRHYRRTTRIHT